MFAPPRKNAPTSSSSSAKRLDSNATTQQRQQQQQPSSARPFVSQDDSQPPRQKMSHFLNELIMNAEVDEFVDPQMAEQGQSQWRVDNGPLSTASAVAEAPPPFAADAIPASSTAVTAAQRAVVSAELDRYWGVPASANQTFQPTTSTGGIIFNPTAGNSKFMATSNAVPFSGAVITGDVLPIPSAASLRNMVAHSYTDFIQNRDVVEAQRNERLAASRASHPYAHDVVVNAPTNAQTKGKHSVNLANAHYSCSYSSQTLLGGPLPPTAAVSADSSIDLDMISRVGPLRHAAAADVAEAADEVMDDDGASKIFYIADEGKRSASPDSKTRSAASSPLRFQVEDGPLPHLPEVNTSSSAAGRDGREENSTRGRRVASSSDTGGSGAAGHRAAIQQLHLRRSAHSRSRSGSRTDNGKSTVSKATNAEKNASSSTSPHYPQRNRSLSATSSSQPNRIHLASQQQHIRGKERDEEAELRESHAVRANLDQRVGGGAAETDVAIDDNILGGSGGPAIPSKSHIIMHQKSQIEALFERLNTMQSEKATLEGAYDHLYRAHDYVIRVDFARQQTQLLMDCEHASRQLLERTLLEELRSFCFEISADFIIGTQTLLNRMKRDFTFAKNDAVQTAVAETQRDCQLLMENAIEGQKAVSGAEVASLEATLRDSRQFYESEVGRLKGIVAQLSSERSFFEEEMARLSSEQIQRFHSRREAAAQTPPSAADILDARRHRLRSQNVGTDCSYDDDEVEKGHAFATVTSSTSIALLSEAVAEVDRLAQARKARMESILAASASSSLGAARSAGDLLSPSREYIDDDDDDNDKMKTFGEGGNRESVASKTRTTAASALERLVCALEEGQAVFEHASAVLEKEGYDGGGGGREAARGNASPTSIFRGNDNCKTVVTDGGTRVALRYLSDAEELKLIERVAEDLERRQAVEAERRREREAASLYDYRGLRLKDEGVGPMRPLIDVHTLTEEEKVEVFQSEECVEFFKAHHQHEIVAQMLSVFESLEKDRRRELMRDQATDAPQRSRGSKMALSHAFGDKGDGKGNTNEAEAEAACYFWRDAATNTDVSTVHQTLASVGTMTNTATTATSATQCDSTQSQHQHRRSYSPSSDCGDDAPFRVHHHHHLQEGNEGSKEEPEGRGHTRRRTSANSLFGGTFALDTARPSPDEKPLTTTVTNDNGDETHDNPLSRRRKNPVADSHPRRSSVLYEDDPTVTRELHQLQLTRDRLSTLEPELVACKERLLVAETTLAQTTASLKTVTATRDALQFEVFELRGGASFQKQAAEKALLKATQLTMANHAIVASKTQLQKALLKSQFELAEIEEALGAQRQQQRQRARGKRGAAHRSEADGCGRGGRDDDEEEEDEEEHPATAVISCKAAEALLEERLLDAEALHAAEMERALGSCCESVLLSVLVDGALFDKVVASAGGSVLTADDCEKADNSAAADHRQRVSAKIVADLSQRLGKETDAKSASSSSSFNPIDAAMMALQQKLLFAELQVAAERLRVCLDETIAVRVGLAKGDYSTAVSSNHGGGDSRLYLSSSSSASSASITRQLMPVAVTSRLVESISRQVHAVLVGSLHSMLDRDPSTPSDAAKRALLNYNDVDENTTVLAHHNGQRKSIVEENERAVFGRSQSRPNNASNSPARHRGLGHQSSSHLHVSSSSQRVPREQLSALSRIAMAGDGCTDDYPTFSAAPNTSSAFTPNRRPFTSQQHANYEQQQQPQRGGGGHDVARLRAIVDDFDHRFASPVSPSAGIRGRLSSAATATVAKNDPRQHSSIDGGHQFGAANATPRRNSTPSRIMATPSLANHAQQQYNYPPRQQQNNQQRHHHAPPATTPPPPQVSLIMHSTPTASRSAPVSRRGSVHYV